MIKDYFGFYTQALLACLAGGARLGEAQTRAVYALEHWIEALPFDGKPSEDADYKDAFKFLDKVRNGL